MPGLIAFALWMTSAKPDPFNVYFAPTLLLWTDSDLLGKFYDIGVMINAND